MSERPNCSRCGTPLDGEVDTIFDLTICPGCGKKTQLTPDRTAIVATVLEVHDATHAAESEFEGENRNG